MPIKTFKISNISCGHCVRTIELELSELDGVLRVDADAESKMVTVEWQEPASWEIIKKTLEHIHYPADA